MKNRTFIILICILILIVFATMLIIRSYNPSRKLQMLEQQELAQNAEIKALLGEAYIFYLNNDLNAAEKRVHLLLRKAPRNLAALQLLGNIFFKQKKYDEAEKTFQNIIRLDSPRSINYNNLGQALAMQGKYIDSIRELKKAAVLSPDMPQPLLNLAEIYIKMNQKKAAVRTLKKAILLSKDKNSIAIDFNAFKAIKDDAEFQKFLNTISQPKEQK